MILLFIGLFLTNSAICQEIPTVAPVPNGKFDSVVENYLNWEFSKCRKYTKCKEDDPSLVYPIVKYFWPGDMLEIECVFCDDKKITDENPKIWRTMSIREAFNFGATGSKEKWQYRRPDSKHWINVQEFANDMVPRLVKKSRDWFTLYDEDRPEPRFFQKDGKLIVVNPGLETQGIYNCYEDSNFIEVVYILIAMAPLTQMPCRIPENYTNTKDFHKNSTCRFPYGNERFHQHWLHTYYYDSTWHRRYFPIHVSRYLAANINKDPRVDESVDMFRYSLGLPEDNLQLYFEWSAWSECSACRPFKGWRSREGHCYFSKAVPDKNIPEKTYDIYKLYARPSCCRTNGPPTYGKGGVFIYTFSDDNKLTRAYLKLPNLNDVLTSKLLPFRDQGIRIHSAFMLEFYCDQGRGVQYHSTDPNCLQTWFKFVFQNSRRITDTRPPNRPVEPNSPNERKKLIHCFDYRVWSDSNDKVKFQYSYEDMYNGLTAEITGGYYYDLRPCIRDCPKLNPYFPNNDDDDEP